MASKTKPGGTISSPATVAVLAGLPEAAITAPAAPAPAFDLAWLQHIEEWLRQNHPYWYWDYLDTFGDSLTQKIAPELLKLTPEQLGLPQATPDRIQRERRALAFAQSYMLAEARDVKRLSAISGDLAYWWNDQLAGKLIPIPPADPSNPAPWVHVINSLHSTHTASMEAAFSSNPRYRSFIKAIKGWTNSRWRHLRAAAKQLLSGDHGGKYHRQASELVQAIRAAPNNAPRLWRKENAADVASRLGTSSDDLFAHLQARAGKEVTQDLVATSAKPDLWNGDFVWEIEPKSKAVHASPVSHHPSESEWITAGRFRLLEVTRDAGRIKVRVEQTGVF